MPRLSLFVTLLLAVLALALMPLEGWPGEDDAVLLVAKRNLRDRVFGSTIVVAKPLGDGRHVGFILNKPTGVTLGKLFPDHAPSRKVTEPVYLGGPFGREVIFALVRRKESPGGRSVQITPGLYLAFDSPIVDRIIEKESGRARFFAGLVVWRQGELDDELKRGLWYVQDAKTELLLRKHTEGLWEELVLRAEQRANAI